MNLTDIKRLVKLVETSDIEELHIQEKGFQIRITKRKSVSGVVSITHLRWRRKA